MSIAIATWKDVLIYADGRGFLFGVRRGERVEVPQDVLTRENCKPFMTEVKK